MHALVCVCTRACMYMVCVCMYFGVCCAHACVCAHVCICVHSCVWCVCIHVCGVCARMWDVCVLMYVCVFPHIYAWGFSDTCEDVCASCVSVQIAPRLYVCLWVGWD